MKKIFKLSKKLSVAFSILLFGTTVLGSLPAYADEAIPTPLYQFDFEENLNATGKNTTKADAVDILSRYDESSIVTMPDTAITYEEGKVGKAAYLNGDTGLNLNLTMDSESYTFSYYRRCSLVY